MQVFFRVTLTTRNDVTCSLGLMTAFGVEILSYKRTMFGLKRKINRMAAKIPARVSI